MRAQQTLAGQIKAGSLDSYALSQTTIQDVQVHNLSFDPGRGSRGRGTVSRMQITAWRRSAGVRTFLSAKAVNC